MGSSANSSLVDEPQLIGGQQTRVTEGATGRVISLVGSCSLVQRPDAQHHQRARRPHSIEQQVEPEAFVQRDMIGR